MIISSWNRELHHGHRLVALLLIITVSFAIRLLNLEYDSLWLDEILTLDFTQSGIEGTQADPHHPPLFYALAAISINALNLGEFAARIPSVMAGTLAISAIALLGTVLGAPSAGLWAALLLALSPLHVHYSQEARQYALLLLLSLLSYGFLLKAMQRPRWSSWLFYALFTVSNLYTHYGALIVLGAQSVLIGLWSITRIINRRKREIIYPSVALSISLVLFLPWLPKFIAAVPKNIGVDTISDTGSVAPLSKWLAVAYSEFGMYSDILAALLLFLCLLGLLYWILDRAWLKLALVLAGIVLPLVLIVLFQVARGVFSRFIIYMLPLYLMAAGNAIDRSLFLTRRIVGQTAYRVLVTIILIGFVILAWPTVNNEYERITEDWRNIVAYFEQNAEDDFVISSISLSNPVGSNIIKLSVPYYLNQAGLAPGILQGNELKVNNIGDLGEIDKPLWGIVNSWTGPPLPEDGSLEVVSFQTNLYIVNEIYQKGSTLERVISLYEKLSPFAISPSPLCFLKRDLSTLYLVAEEYEQSETALVEGKHLCPGLEFSNTITIYEGLLRKHLSSGDSEKIIEFGRKILIYDAKNMLALDSLSAFNLQDLFEEGEAIIVADDSPEPVGTKRFTMPQDGDWGEVLFTHPPATVGFDLSLPKERTFFRSRIALAPVSWSWGGDGVSFMVLIQDESGKTEELFRQHISNDSEDQRWHSVLIPLSEFAGKSITLTLKTESGPSGDGTGDWAGWESPRIMWDVPE